MTRPRTEMSAVDLDAEGRGVAPWEGRELAVAGLLPGETGTVEVTDVSRHHPRAAGVLLERRSLAPDRVQPACPAFGRCGGCVWQHLAYPSQLAWKARRVTSALADAGLRAAIAAPVAAPRVLGYRNKGKYVAAEGPAGGLVLGAYAARSHEVVDTAGCRVVEPRIAAAQREARALLEASGLPVYDERRRTGALRYIVVRAGDDERVSLCLVTTSRADGGALRSCARALVESGAVTGVSHSLNDTRGGALFAAGAHPLAGDPHVGVRVAGASLEVDATSFWQVNAAQARAVYGAIADAHRGGRAVDLYGGLGGIALSLASRGIPVTTIERHGAAAAAARAAADAAGWRDRLTAVHGDASASAAHLKGAAFVAVNPPRKGLGAPTLAALLSAAPDQIAYLSCGPVSLARDLAALATDYEIERIAPYDFMPGTAQIETLALLGRRRAA